jgi:hypothetical protein
MFKVKYFLIAAVVMTVVMFYCTVAIGAAFYVIQP